MNGWRDVNNEPVVLKDEPVRYAVRFRERGLYYRETTLHVCRFDAINAALDCVRRHSHLMAVEIIDLENDEKAIFTWISGTEEKR